MTEADYKDRIEYLEKSISQWAQLFRVCTITLGFLSRSDDPQTARCAKFALAKVEDLGFDYGWYDEPDLEDHSSAR